MMRVRVWSCWIILGLVVTLVGCSRSTGLKPGDKVGDIVLVQAQAPEISESATCQSEQDVPEPIPPGTYTFTCTVLSTDTYWIAEGWISKTQQTLDANWAVMNWEIFIDDQQLDLTAFETTDEQLTTGPYAGGTYRHWTIGITNLTGRHTIRSVKHVQTEFNDGWFTFQTGTYIRIFNVTGTS